MVIATFSMFIIYTDIKHRIVSNNSCAVVAILCGCYAFIYTEVQVLIPIVILIIGVSLSYFKILGGGDSKLLSSYSIAIFPDVYLSTLIVIGISGGVLSVIYILVNKLNRNKTKQIHLPYAIPIVLGGLIGILAST